MKYVILKMHSSTADLYSYAVLEARSISLTYSPSITWKTVGSNLHSIDIGFDHDHLRTTIEAILITSSFGTTSASTETLWNIIQSFDSYELYEGAYTIGDVTYESIDYKLLKGPFGYDSTFDTAVTVSNIEKSDIIQDVQKAQEDVWSLELNFTINSVTTEHNLTTFPLDTNYIQSITRNINNVNSYSEMMQGSKLSVLNSQLLNSSIASKQNSSNTTDIEFLAKYEDAGALFNWFIFSLRDDTVSFVTSEDFFIFQRNKYNNNVKIISITDIAPNDYAGNWWKFKMTLAEVL